MMGAFDDLIKSPASSFDDLIPNDNEGARYNDLASQPKGAPTAADYGRTLLRGLSSAAGAIGQAGEFAGELTGIEGLRQSGKDIRVGAEKGRQMLARGMTPAGRAAAESEIVREVEPKNRHPLVREALTALGIKAPGLEWGPTPISSAAMQAVESLPGMAAMAATGGPISAGLKKLGGKTLAEIAARKGVAGYAAKVAPTAIGYGAAEGGYAGMQNAASIRNEIEQIPIERLRGVPAFDTEVSALDSSIPISEREVMARDEVARKAAGDVAVRTALSTGLIGAATGGGALGLIHRGAAKKAVKDGVIKSTLKGAGAEALQETPQSGAEAYISNLARQQYIDPSIDPMKGVVGQGLSGGVVGGLTGGVFGAGGAMLQRRTPTSPETPGPQVPDAEISDEELINEINAAMGDEAAARSATAPGSPGNVPVSSSAETFPPGPRTQEELIADIRRKSEEDIIAEREKQLEVQRDEQRNAAYADLDRKSREEQAAVAEAVARQGDAPTVMEQAFAVAKKGPPETAQAAPAQPDIIPKSGIPFKTQKSADLFARSNKIAGHEPVNVGVEKWVLRPITPEQTITPEQEAELAALLRLKNAETAQPVSPPIPETALSLSPNVAQIGIVGAPTIGGSGNAETLRSDQGQMRQGREDELRQLPEQGGAYREQPQEQGRQAANETAQEVALNRPGVRAAVNNALVTARGDIDTAISNLERESSALRGMLKDNPAMAGNVTASERVIDGAITYIRKTYLEPDKTDQPAPKQENGDNLIESRPLTAVANPKPQSAVMGIPAKPKAKPVVSVNPAKDSLIVAMAKLGGLDATEAEAQGVDPAYFKRKGGAQSGVFGKPWIRRTDGRTFDEMAELLDQYGYFPQGTSYGPNELLDLIDRELGGDKVYTPAGFEAKAERDYEERLTQEDIKNIGLLAEEAYDDPFLLHSLEAIESLPPNSEIYTDEDLDAIIQKEGAINEERSGRLAEINAAIQERESIEAGSQKGEETEGEPGQIKPETAARANNQSSGADLLGDDTAKAQSVADAARKQDEKRSGTRDVPIGTGEFSGQEGKLEPDLFDRQTDAITKMADVVSKLADKVEAIGKEITPSLPKTEAKEKKGAISGGASIKPKGIGTAQGQVEKTQAEKTEEPDHATQAKEEAGPFFSKETNKNIPDTIEIDGERSDAVHTIDSATKAIMSAHSGKEKAAIQAMMDADIVKVVTADEAVDIAGGALFTGEGRAMAFFNPADGTSYFIADNMRAGMTPEQVRKLAQHEIAVHAFQLGKDSKEFKSILSQVELMRKAGNKAVIAAYQRAVDAGTREANIPEESLAYLIEQNPDLPIIKRVVAWMRNAIREIGKKMPVMVRAKLFSWASELSVDDLLWMAQTALARSYKAGGVEVTTEKTGAVLASKESLSDGANGVAETGGIVGDRFTLPAETRGEQIRRKIQDDAIRIQKVQEAVLRQGGEITEDSDIAKAIKLYPGRLASRIHDLNKKIVDPLLERMTRSGITMDDVGLYKYAMHAKERNAEIAKIRKDLPNDGKPGNSGSGMTDEMADEIIKQAEAHPKFKAIKQASDILDKIMDSRLNFLVKEGVMSKDQADAYRAKYKHYVPLKGFENADVNGAPQGTGRGMSTGRKIDFRALGRQSMAKDVFQNIIRDTETAMMLAEKARVGKVAREFVLANQDVKLWSVDKIHKDRYFKKGREIHVVYQDGEAIAEFKKKDDAEGSVKQLKLYSDGEITLKTEREDGLTVLKDSQFDENEEIMFIDGSDVVRIQFTDPLITRAYNRLWNNGVSDGLKTLNAYNGLLRQMYTQKNPAFFVLNAFRDVQAVVPYLAGEHGAKLAFKAMGNMIGAKKAAWNFYHQKPLGPVWTDVMNRFRLSGGGVGFAYVGDIEAKTIELEGTLAKYTSWKDSVANVKKGNIKRGMHGVLVKALNSKGIAWIEALNSSFENMSRLATFKAAVDSGLSDKDAAMLAKHVTVNFNARGEWGPNMNAVWLFSNASIQGSRNIGHALLYSKHKGQVWALAGGLMALGIMAGLIGDDEDDLVRGDERGKALVFKFGDSTVKWPMPYGWGFFGGMGQLVAQSMKHPESHDKIAVEMADLTMQHFGIIGNPFAGGSNDLIGAVNLLPTLPKPFAQAGANRSSFGGQLYPESPFDETTPDSEKAWRSTKGSGYDVTAKWINDISGGDSAQEGFVSVSPESLKLGVSTVTGGVGRLITDLFSIPFKATSDKEMSPKDFPVFKNFVGEIGVDEYRKRFMDQSRRAKEAYQTYKKYQAKGDMSGADSYLAENEAIVNLGRMVGNYNKQIRLLRDDEDHVNNDASMSSDRRKTELKIIENRMIDLAKEFNEKIKDMD